MPLDAPHTKAYHLIYDRRLHALKEPASLIGRTQEGVYTPRVGGGLGHWVGTSYAFELGTWGEKAVTGSLFWTPCARLWARWQLTSQCMMRGWGLGAHLPWLYLGWAWSGLACRSRGGLGDGRVWGVPAVTAEEQQTAWAEQTVTAASADFTPACGAYHLELLGAGLPGFVTPDLVSHLYAPSGGLVGLGLRGSWWFCHTSLEVGRRSLGRGPALSSLASAPLRCRGAHWALVWAGKQCDGCP